jgi:hypothetical protein
MEKGRMNRLGAKRGLLFTGRKQLERCLVTAASALVVAVAVATAAVSAVAADSAGAAPEPQQETTPVDVLLAFDTTASMRESLERARTEGVAIVKDIVEILPGTRLGVVSFRDFQNPAGEYEVLQPLTVSREEAEAGLQKLRTARNPIPHNGLAESYNLLFRNSYSDATLGWRTDSRKIVVVFGDAEPYGAGASGIEGCVDKRKDPHGLDTATELAAMRDAKRTLVMIRQVSSATSVTLDCYRSLAARAYVGGSAADVSASGFGTRVTELVARAYAPVSLAPDRRFALRGGTIGFTVSLRNPNDETVILDELSITLPPRFSYRRRTTTGAGEPARNGQILTWPLHRSLAPGARAAIHVVAAAPRAVSKRDHVAGATATVTGANGLSVLARVAAPGVRVGAPARRISFSMQGADRPGSGARAVRGSGGSTRGRAARSLLQFSSRGRVVAVRVTGVAALRLGSPSVLRVTGTVVAARRMPGCPRGASVVATLTDSNALHGDGRVSDRIVARLPGACAGAAGTWANAGGATARVTVGLS